ncbi:sigma-70 family RNA polymerase sigma factor [Streptomyces sp. NPDC093225]|uniref:sigma-70 family RNA polymerase sigma factor n=1 Tax=Streptomyces sp. NPDC093225 TaxID=3366034 RepID=UPI003819FE73
MLRDDEHCLGEAYRRWGGLVHALAARALGDAREAEDVTQQVFLAAWRGRAGYRPERGPLAGWLVGIARKKTADALSARTRRNALLVAATAAHLTEAGPTGTDHGGPDAVLDRLTLDRELARLPYEQRRVLALAYLCDLTQVQVAQHTGLPLGTVKSHVRRGLGRLRRGLEPAARDGSAPSGGTGDAPQRPAPDGPPEG